MNEFNIGDNVRVKTGEGRDYGKTLRIADLRIAEEAQDTLEVIKVVNNLLDVKNLRTRTVSYSCAEERFFLINKQGRPKKQTKQELHLVVQEDCHNIIGSIKNDLNDAKNFNVENGVTYMIYKLVPVLKVEMSKKFTKVKVKKKRR